MNASSTRWLALPIAAIITIFFAACSGDHPDPTGPERSVYPTSYSATSGGFHVDLDVVNNNDGTWTWTWAIYNTNPGNGKRGTYQDMSHIDMILEQCVDPDDIVYAGMNINNAGWVEFTPIIAIDYSVSACNTGPVLKFDGGTVGGATTYYRLVLVGDYEPVQNAGAVIKVGTACNTIFIPGIGCPYSVNVLYGYETAWGDGARFVQAGNWGMYFEYSQTDFSNNLTKVVTLFADQTLAVGTVSVGPGTQPGYNLDVTYALTAANPPYQLAGIHLHLADQLSGFPLNLFGNPQIGLFDYNIPLSPVLPNTTWVTSHTVHVNYTGAWPVLIGAHAVVGIPVTP